ncbi:MAG: ThuA domain-containing protein [Lachnospiraceae bacterium]|nr:ThuA domain-containing protein [Lachnospiraceae bacterium]
MNRKKVVFLVSPMGHDVIRIARILTKWLSECGDFDTEIAGIHPEATCSITEYMQDEKKVKETDLFFFLCADDYWSKENETVLAREVNSGKGVLFYHGVHPCFRNNPEIEKMIGLLWRETATHGDYNTCSVSITDDEHPITKGLKGFDTSDELFCLLENVHNVPLKVLATAYSDEKRESRWGHLGTGRDEPVLTVGEYGEGRCVDFILGHVWTYYTGHGLMENTTLSMEPEEFKIMLLRSCQWACGLEADYK